MKTNQEMIRKMGEFDVVQRTKDSFFDGGYLLRQWNSIDENPRRRMAEFIDSPKTKEFLKALAVDESHRSKSDIGENQLLIKVSGRNTKDGKTPDKVWMSPLLFIKFGMWINPAFEVKVLRFVYDELIKYRNEAGDAYKEMCSEIQSISPEGVSFQDIIRGVSRALNIVVYGKHEKMIRNKVGDESKARELLELEKDIAKMIKRKFIKSLVELRQFMLAEYRERHEPKLLVV